jgi:hypothetical protein
MPAHKFRTGDRVAFLPGRSDLNVTRGIYTVVRPLPLTSEGPQYRVKNAHDGYERVINEAQICPAA